MKKIGLIVNPMAGIGGRVGLKGSDGEEIRRRAFSLGAVQEAPAKAMRALTKLSEEGLPLQIITCPADMGETEAIEAGFSPEVIPLSLSKETSADDTREAAGIMKTKGIDLLLFAGGDGTARDVCEIIGTDIPAVGIPAGVKIHSGVYGSSPVHAGEIAAMYLSGKKKMMLREMEVMDIDEDAFREDRVSARLYGYMKVPYERRLLQSAKAGSSMSEKAAVQSIASDVVSGMNEDELYIIGPGSTTRGIMTMLGLPNTLLGVDVVRGGKLVISDAGERDLLSIMDEHPKVKTHIIVTVIGGQGYIFGRGNQQISPEVIRRAGVRNVQVIATESKMIALEGRPLLVDTGDEELNRELEGYKMVVTAQGKRMMYRVSS